MFVGLLVCWHVKPIAAALYQMSVSWGKFMAAGRGAKGIWKGSKAGERKRDQRAPEISERQSGEGHGK